MGKALAVSRYTLLELSRRRILLVFVAVSVLLMAAIGVAPLLVPAARTPAERTLFTLDTVSRVVGLAAALCAYAVGMTVINHDLDSGAAVGIFAKPVGRASYAAGKLFAATAVLVLVDAILGVGAMVIVALNGGGHAQLLFWFFAATAANIVLTMLLLMILTVYLNNIVAAVIVFAFGYVDGILVSLHTSVQEKLIPLNGFVEAVANILYWGFPHPLTTDMQREILRLQFTVPPPGASAEVRQRMLAATTGASGTAEVVFWFAYLAVLCGLLFLAVRRKQV